MTDVAECLVSEVLNGHTSSNRYKLSDVSIDLLVDILLSIAIKEENDATCRNRGEAA